MREIVMDTETTGFDPDKGDRVVEIGAIELINHLPTGNRFHKYINPERDVPDDAVRVHGLTTERLANEPKFAEIAVEFLDFVGPDAKLIAHNATFDFRFLNHELARAGHPILSQGRMIDTLMIARNKFPGSPASLDALCRRFNIDNSNRVLHGALLDSEILAEVYLELIGGRQPDLAMLVQEQATTDTPQQGVQIVPRHQRPQPSPTRLTKAEAAAHDEFVAKLGDKAVWLKYSDQED